MSVIPALRQAQDRLTCGQAGIQSKKTARVAGKMQYVVPLAWKFLNHLDSRLRGNDGFRDWMI